MFDAGAADLEIVDRPLVCVDALLRLSKFVECCPLDDQSGNVASCEESLAKEDDVHEADRDGFARERVATGNRNPRKSKEESHPSNGGSASSSDEGEDPIRGGKP